MREAGIERAFVRAVKRAGGEAHKLVTPGRRHAPDRLVLWPGTPEMLDGIVEFVELKKPGRKPRKGQLREHYRLRDMGFKVYVVASKQDIAAYVRGGK